MRHNGTFNDEIYQASIDYNNFISIANYAIPIVCGMITLMGFLGNGLVIWTILTNKKMKTPTNMLILNLAVTDFLFVVICVPFEEVEWVLPRYIFGTVWCKISNYFIFVCACVSIFNLVFISMVRCIVVVYPITSKSWITTRRIWLAIAAVWIIILGGFSPCLVHYEVFPYTVLGEERSKCTNIDPKSDYLIFTVFFAFGCIALFIMMILYGILLIMLRSGTRTMSLEMSRQRNRVQGQATKMVIAVILCFLLCWLPIEVIFFMAMFGAYPNTTVGYLCITLANCLAYFNSCMNPILYAFLSSQFRHSFRQALCCCRLSDAILDLSLGCRNRGNTDAVE